MKRTIISVALLAVLSTMAVSCQKENLSETQNASTVIGSVRTVSYTIDGITHRITLYNDSEWDAFIDNMLSLSKHGHNVRFVNKSSTMYGTPSKEVLKLITESQDEAKKWAKEKSEQGYTVSTTYKDGKYTCVAFK